MAHTAELRRRGSATYWLPRGATRSKPFQCRPFGVWSCLRRGSCLPVGPGVVAAALRRATTSGILRAAIENCHLRRCCAPDSSAARHGRRQRTTGACLWRRGSFGSALRTHSAPWLPRRPDRNCDVAAFGRGRSRDRPPPTTSRGSRTTPSITCNTCE